MQRYKCTIAYIGTRYAGWQIQEEAKAPLTIQSELEKVLLKVCGKLVRIHGAGRTDAGVHADGQVAHFDCALQKSPKEWEQIFANLLPHDINVYKVEKVEHDFHSRFQAKNKSYAYTLWIGDKSKIPPRLRPFVWPCSKQLDVKSMNAALVYLQGEHDFCALQNVGTRLENTVRTMYHLEIIQGSIWAPSFLQSSLLTFNVKGDGFLKQMVRNMIGLLVAVGQGRLDHNTIPKLLAEKNRPKLPATAPACGLTLMKIEY